MVCRLPSYVFGLIGKQDDRLSVWTDTAQKLPIHTATTNRSFYEFDGKKEYHPEFDGFTLDEDEFRGNQTVKQADVILLGYPLDMEMSRQIRENDLDLYRQVQSVRRLHFVRRSAS